ncbi:hypothetical protein NPIL_698751 [Nephila pilipes]|uniref:Uncharacterized protein n=1 Tax=Nephila pilipes TaxID=299642 RepID=A0A8X6U4B2_NEPPI|nr:hypothetical protein NPIL_698751 [Nephila pilipes]
MPSPNDVLFLSWIQCPRPIIVYYPSISKYKILVNISADGIKKKNSRHRRERESLAQEEVDASGPEWEDPSSLQGHFLLSGPSQNLHNAYGWCFQSILNLPRCRKRHGDATP